MTDETKPDPNGEMQEGQPEPPPYIFMGPIPESPRGKLARASHQKRLESEKPEEAPEPPGQAIVEPVPESSPQGRFANASQQEKPKAEEPEEKPRPRLYSVVEPAPENPQGRFPNTSQQERPKAEEPEEKPRPRLYSVVEPAPENPQGKFAKTSQQKTPRGERPVEKPELPDYEIPELPDYEIPEPPGYVIMEPVPESPQVALGSVGRQSQDGEEAKEKPEPLGYVIVEPPLPLPSDRFIQAGLAPSVGVGTYAKARNSAREPATGLPSTGEAPVEKIPKPAQRPSKVYLWLVVGLGVLFGCIFAVVFSRLTSPDPGHDWGSTTFDAAGLKGHLFTKWDKKLEYRLTIQPGDPERRAGFALAVAHSPRPLSVQIQLHDAQGFVLCSREIVLKYDAASAPALAASNTEPQAGKAGAAVAAVNPPTQAMEDLLAAQEAERELGKEVFQNEIGPDGQIASIAAQGDISCSEKAYGSVSSWSFTPDFPSLAEQDELTKREQEQANGGRAAAEGAARRKAASIPAPKLLPFSIEGDDAIVDYDVSRGTIETRAGKTFLFDKTSGEINNPRWQDYPVSIHYRCDQTATCMITHAGAGALRTRMSR